MTTASDPAVRDSGPHAVWIPGPGAAVLTQHPPSETLGRLPLGSPLPKPCSLFSIHRQCPSRTPRPPGIEMQTPRLRGFSLQLCLV